MITTTNRAAKLTAGRKIVKFCSKSRLFLNGAADDQQSLYQIGVKPLPVYTQVFGLPLTLIKQIIMPDHLKHKSPQDKKRISLTEDWEVKYWTEALACSVLQLKAAVNAVGHPADAVKTFLKK